MSYSNSDRYCDGCARPRSGTFSHIPEYDIAELINRHEPVKADILVYDVKLDLRPSLAALDAVSVHLLSAMLRLSSWDVPLVLSFTTICLGLGARTVCRLVCMAYLH